MNYSTFESKLKEGVTHFKDVVFDGIDFWGNSFIDLEFSHCTFIRCVMPPDIENVKFRDSFFQKSSFKDVGLENVTFESCFFKGQTDTSFVGTDFHKVKFESCFLAGVSFKKALLYGVSWMGCSLDRACFEGAKLNSCDFYSCSLQDAVFDGEALIKHTKFLNSSLNNVSFEGAHLVSSSFFKSSVFQAWFKNAKIKKTQLPSPLHMLTASWGDVKDRDLIADCVRFNASCTLNGEEVYQELSKNSGRLWALEYRDAIDVCEEKVSYTPGLVKTPLELATRLLETSCEWDGWILEEV